MTPMYRAELDRLLEIAALAAYLASHESGFTTGTAQIIERLVELTERHRRTPSFLTDAPP
jgi:hypothetical protein